MAETPEHRAWGHMKDRCQNPKSQRFDRYGARGITVCEEWRNSFEAFFAYVGLRPSPEHSLERINNDGNYEPGNVEWAVPERQNNNKATSVFLEFGGERLTIAQWSKRLGIQQKTLSERLKAGWTVEEIVTTPAAARTWSKDGPMADNSSIEWTTHTFNPWIGCQRVHTGCLHCYAETFSRRYGKATWGPSGTRVKTAPVYWKKPLKWERDAAASGVRARVFCASLADVFEDWQETVHAHNGEVLTKTMHDLRMELFALIDATPHLDWLLLTKRPRNVLTMWPLEHITGTASMHGIRKRENVWLGTSVSDQETADKAIPELLMCRDLTPVLFLSAEPLVGPVNLSVDGIDWVIVGGESGAGARPCDIEWIRSIRDQCHGHAACFIKQLGSHDQHKNKKGGDWDEWPADLRVRDYPEHAHVQ